MAVEVLAAPIMHGCRSWVGMASGDLDVSERDAGVKGGHDEGGSKHVGVDQSDPSPLTDGSDPPMGGAPVEALTVVAERDGSFSPLTRPRGRSCEPCAAPEG